MTQVERIVDSKDELGEGPIWDAEAQCLYWVDISGGILHRYDPQSGQHDHYKIGQFVGTVVPWRKEEVMLAVHEGFASYHLGEKRLTLRYQPENEAPHNRFNDGKCDPAGRFWAGTMALNMDPFKGALYRMETDFSVQKVLDGVGISNGLVWSANQRLMYFIDSQLQNIQVFDYDLTTGAINNPRVLVEVPDEAGTPDGMAIDADGMLWTAQHGGSRVCRWSSQTGELLTTIPLPVSNVTACAFGGPHLDTLYITSARVEDEELSGALLAIKPGVSGIKSTAFGA